MNDSAIFKASARVTDWAEPGSAEAQKATAMISERVHLSNNRVMIVRLGGTGAVPSHEF